MKNADFRHLDNLGSHGVICLIVNVNNDKRHKGPIIHKVRSRPILHEWRNYEVTAMTDIDEYNQSSNLIPPKRSQNFAKPFSVNLEPRTGLAFFASRVVYDFGEMLDDTKDSETGRLLHMAFFWREALWPWLDLHFTATSRLGFADRIISSFCSLENVDQPEEWFDELEAFSTEVNLRALERKDRVSLVTLKAYLEKSPDEYIWRTVNDGKGSSRDTIQQKSAYCVTCKSTKQNEQNNALLLCDCDCSLTKAPKNHHPEYRSVEGHGQHRLCLKVQLAIEQESENSKWICELCRCIKTAPESVPQQGADDRNGKRGTGEPEEFDSKIGPTSKNSSSSSTSSISPDSTGQ